MKQNANFWQMPLNPSLIPVEKFESNMSIVKNITSAFLSTLMDWICKSGSVQAKLCVSVCDLGVCSDCVFGYLCFALGGGGVGRAWNIWNVFVLV